MSVARPSAPRRGTAGLLLAVMLVAVACVPLEAEAAGGGCGAGHAPDASPTAGSAAEPRAGDPEAPPPLCAQHCRSADHGLQSLAPDAGEAPAARLLLLHAADAPRAAPASAVAARARAGPAPPPARSRPILNCSLRL